MNFSFSKAQRLVVPFDFKRVFAKPDKRGCREFVILARENSFTHPRLGLTVAKRHAKRAIERNRIKRIVRESFRHQQHLLPCYDFVFIAKAPISSLSNEQLFQRLDALWIKLGEQWAKSWKQSHSCGQSS